MLFNKHSTDIGMSFPFEELLARGPVAQKLNKVFFLCQVASAWVSEQKHSSFLSQKFDMGLAYFITMKKKEYIFTYFL